MVRVNDIIMVKFSIIIPVYNAESYLETCLNSLFNQGGIGYQAEIIVIDDCSTDNTLTIARQYADNIKIYSTSVNSGPGIARNIGLKNATGSWILFLDSDDTLDPNALSQLAEYINHNNCVPTDIISYNATPPRKDINSLLKNKNEMLKDYLSLKMDGSVIFTLIGSDVINNGKLKFYGGLHEDVDFLFKVYWYAQNIHFFDKPLYLKNDREGSIVNTVSVRHLQGFFRAYSEMLFFLKENDANWQLNWQKAFSLGLIAVIATRLRDFHIKKIPENQKNELCKELYNLWRQFKDSFDDSVLEGFQTKYIILAKEFFRSMETKTPCDAKAILKKSWSCYDLHNSVFLAPDEIRTCCKRFFVNGVMKGDVVLLKSGMPEINAAEILKAKQQLYIRLNAGTAKECEGCPFLEFKEWGAITDLNIENLSLEYHSICNLRCIYCCDKYYGGKLPAYDIEQLINQFIEDKNLVNCKSIVWGGGEPTLDKAFIPIIDKICFNYPAVPTRVITNAVKYSEKVKELLDKGKITITTSVDAGTEETYTAVRGKSHLHSVLENLQNYSEINPQNVTVKYILTEQNNNYEEIFAFIDLIKKYKLIDCNFQLSYNFLNETADNKSIVSAILLYGLLSEIDCRLVFFDDLLRQRLSGLKDNDEKFIIDELNKFGKNHYLADKNKYESVIIWGAGWQTKFYIENSLFFKKVNIKYLVDSTPNKINTKFMGLDILNPDVLLKTDMPVLISAVQGYPIIYQKYKALGLDSSRLIEGVII